MGIWDDNAEQLHVAWNSLWVVGDFHIPSLSPLRKCQLAYSTQQSVGWKHAFCHMCAQTIPPAPAETPAPHWDHEPAVNKPTPGTSASRPLPEHRALPSCCRRPAYLRWWPVLSFFPFGLLFLAWMAITAGARLRLSTGMTIVRVREGCKRDREQTNTHHQDSKLADMGHLALFGMHCLAFCTPKFGHISFRMKPKVEQRNRVGGWGILTLPGAHVSSSSLQQEQAARRQQPESPLLPRSQTLTH